MKSPIKIAINILLIALIYLGITNHWWETSDVCAANCGWTSPPPPPPPPWDSCNFYNDCGDGDIY